MYSDNSLLLSVQTGFLNVTVKFPFLPTLILKKISDQNKIFWQDKI